MYGLHIISDGTQLGRLSEEEHKYCVEFVGEYTQSISYVNCAKEQ